MSCTSSEKMKAQKREKMSEEWSWDFSGVGNDFEPNIIRRAARIQVPRDESAFDELTEIVDPLGSMDVRGSVFPSDFLRGADRSSDRRAFYRKHLQELDSKWKKSRTPLVIVAKTAASPFQGNIGIRFLAASDPEDTPDDDNFPVDWRFSAEEILRRLEGADTPWAERIDAVLFAETTAFDAELKPRLVRGLQGFCEAHRFSADKETITAVGAAIRKYAMNLSGGDLDGYAHLFGPTSTQTLSCEVELELAKAIGWRLARAESAEWNHSSELKDRLTDLASDYLSVRLILQENYASIVMHALIAICLLRAERREELIGRASELKIEWFTDLLGRRMWEVAEKLEGERRSDLGRMIELLRQPVAQEA